MEVEGGLKLVVVRHAQVGEFGGVTLEFVLLGVLREKDVDEKADEGGDSINCEEGGEIVIQEFVGEFCEFLDIPCCSNSGWFE